MEINAKKVSVIVPAYNVEALIEKCVDSLISQTYSNLEILVIDDGSTDKTGQLLDRKYGNNAKVLIYHKRNGGLSDARNYGLDRMTGEYVTFVDSDDYVDTPYIEYLINLVEAGTDIAIIPPQPFFVDNTLNKEYDLAYEVVSSQEAVRRMLVRDSIAHTACGKLYRSSMWKELRFPYKKLYEDYYTTFEAFSKAQNVAVGRAGMYFYFQRESSIMHLECTKDTVSIIEATTQVTPIIESYWPILEIEALDLQIALCLKCLKKIYQSKSMEFSNEKKCVIKLRNKNAVRLLFSNRIPFKDKVKIVISYLPANLFLRIYNWFDGNKGQNNR